MLFLGYDPGGKGNHGVAALTLGDDARLRDPASQLNATRCHSRVAALQWFRERIKRQPCVALGVDAPLALSMRSDRGLDKLLRTYRKVHARQYSEELKANYRRTKLRVYSNGGQVMPQDMLWSSVIGNGVLVAHHLQRNGLDVVESHPKLVVRVLRVADAESSVVDKYEELVETESENGSGDHAADAFIAAWCASRWYFQDPDWQTNLYGADPQDRLFFPAGPAVYPWPGSITSTNGQSGASAAE